MCVLLKTCACGLCNENNFFFKNNPSIGGAVNLLPQLFEARLLTNCCNQEKRLTLSVSVILS